MVGDGINRIDASGVEVVEHLAERLDAAGVALHFYALKPQVIEVLRNCGAFDKLAPRLLGEEDLARLIGGTPRTPALAATGTDR